MNTKLIQFFRVPSLVVAAALQIFPMARTLLPATGAASNVLAIIFRWAVGAAAVTAVDAVSGASTAITTPISQYATQNMAFSVRLATAPQTGTYYKGTNLPSGITVSGTGGSSFWQLTGTPTVSGTFVSTIWASDQSSYPRSETTVTNITFHITAAGGAPFISSQPASVSVAQGQSANFSVTAGGTAPLAFQWWFNGSSLSGQTSSNLVINPATTNNAGNYTVVVSNGSGSVTSSPATLTISTPPAITTQPLSQSNVVGTTFSFSVAASGTAPFTYQWTKSGVNLSNTGNYSGTTSNIFKITSAQTTNSGNYAVVVANSAGSVTSQVAVLTVSAVPPSITSQPASQTVAQGQSANFSVTASGTAPLTYQWWFNGSSLGGQTASTLTLNPVTTNNAGSYTVVVANSAGSVTSAPATLTVTIPPAITTQPLSQSNSVGTTFTFTVAATGTAPLTYQWTKSGVNLSNTGNYSGTTSNVFKITSAQTTNSGNYAVVVANSAGSVTSQVAVLTVGSVVVAPDITTPPASQSVVQGQSANFSVAASGTAPLTYQWWFNGSTLGGQTASTLTLNPVSTNNAGSYTVVVANSAGSVTSAPATLTVLVPPSITTQPLSQSNLVGTTFNFTVAATGTAPLTYQWTKGGVNLSDTGSYSGSQSSSFTITSAQTNDSGSYAVVIANSAGSVTSQVAVLTVAPILGPVANMRVYVNGTGSVNPNYDNVSLLIGHTYTMTATAGSGFYFTNWTGSMKSNSATISFVMKSNLVLQANFLFPFSPGVYRGLFYDPSGVTVSNAGAVTLSVTKAGSYSGSIKFANKQFGLSGKFDVFGNALKQITLSKGNMAYVSLTINNTDKDRLTGTVANAVWSVPISGDRAIYNAKTNPAPQLGRYTLAVPGDSSNVLNPAGAGFGTLTINSAGIITFAGTLADGTVITQGSGVSKDGDWPLFKPAYSGAGLVFGWQTFSNAVAEDLSGPLCWIRPAMPKAKYYPAGFAFIPTLSGSLYTPPATGVAPIQRSAGDFMLSDGGLSQSYTNLITVLPSGKATNNVAAVKMSLNVARATGIVSGSFVNPQNNKTFQIHGVILQKPDMGVGFFLSTNLSGQISF